MDDTEVREWLKATNRSRDWLAVECNVSAATVKGWLSAGKPITGAAEALIRRLMHSGIKLDPEFTLEEWDRIKAHASAAGLSPHAWIKQVLKDEISKPIAPPVKPGQTATPVDSLSNIMPMPPQHIAAETPESVAPSQPPKKVTYASGTRRKK